MWLKLVATITRLATSASSVCVSGADLRESHRSWKRAWRRGRDMLKVTGARPARDQVERRIGDAGGVEWRVGDDCRRGENTRFCLHLCSLLPSRHQVSIRQARQERLLPKPARHSHLHVNINTRRDGHHPPAYHAHTHQKAECRALCLGKMQAAPGFEPWLNSLAEPDERLLDSCKPRLRENGIFSCAYSLPPLGSSIRARVGRQEVVYILNLINAHPAQLTTYH